MARFRGACTLFAAVGLASTVVAQDAMTRLECLSSALRSTPSWHAGYEQEYTPSGMAFAEEAVGEVWVSWPDKALFSTGRPPVRLLGLHGRTVRLVDLEVPSCDEHALDDREWARIPLAAVLDPAAALESFTILPLDEKAVGFALVPRDPGGVDRVEILLDDTCMPVSVLIVDPQAATNVLRFQSWRKVDPPGDGRWLPQPPDGVECSVDVQ